MAIGPALALAVVLGCSGATPTPSPSSAPATPSPSVSALTQSSTAAGSSSLLKPQALGTVDGAPLGYMEYLPPGYGDGSARPLLLAFHGSGESGTGDTGSLYKLVGTGVPWVMVHDRWPLDRPFVVLAPQHDDSGDEACTTSDEVNDFLDFALKHYQVDPTGVYLTGYSCGAVGVWDYLGDHTNEAVAAAVPIAGDGRPAIEKAGCDLGKVPIWAFHRRS
jgi:predicted peptidase